METLLQKQTILVTGGAGYIGAHLVRQLLAEKYEVVVIDDLSYGKTENLSVGAAFIKGDFAQRDLLNRIFAGHKIDAVIHLAASIEVGESVEQPAKYLENNTIKTERLISSMLEHGVNRLVFSSTAAVYGIQDKVPIPESAAVDPLDPYGASKLLSENLIHYYAQFSGLKAIIFRFFNVCGTDPDDPIADGHQSHLITHLLEVAKGNAPELIVHGSDYPTPDGTGVRDYVHVLDIARAHIAGLEQLSNLDGVALYNIGTNSGQSVKEVIAAAEKVIGKPIPHQFGPRRPGDATITVADNRKIKKELNFELKHSDLENIIKTSWH